MTEAESIAADFRADGQAMILSRLTPGVKDIVLGKISDPIPQQWTVYGITRNYSGGDRAASAGIIQQGDKKAMIEATTEPQPGDTLEVMDVKWRIMAVDDVSPQGEVLFYNLQLRR